MGENNFERKKGLLKRSQEIREKNSSQKEGKKYTPEEARKIMKKIMEKMGDRAGKIEIGDKIIVRLKRKNSTEKKLDSAGNVRMEKDGEESAEVGEKTEDKLKKKNKDKKYPELGQMLGELVDLREKLRGIREVRDKYARKNKEGRETEEESDCKKELADYPPEVRRKIVIYQEYLKGLKDRLTEELSAELGNDSRKLRELLRQAEKLSEERDNINIAFNLARNAGITGACSDSLAMHIDPLYSAKAGELEKKIEELKREAEETKEKIEAGKIRLEEIGRGNFNITPWR